LIGANFYYTDLAAQAQLPEFVFDVILVAVIP